MSPVICRCPQCSTDPLPTWTPAWRTETEARWLLKQPLEFRREYLAKKLVLPRAESLKAEMIRLHGAAQAAAKALEAKRSSPTC